MLYGNMMHMRRQKPMFANREDKQEAIDIKNEIPYIVT